MDDKPANDNKLVFKPQLQHSGETWQTLDHHPRMSIISSVSPDTNDIASDSSKEDDKKFRTVLRKWMQHELAKEEM